MSKTMRSLPVTEPSLTARPRGGALRTLIILLTLFAAGVHAYFVFKPDEPQWVRVSFTGVALGYVILLAAIYLPGAALAWLRGVGRFFLMGLAATVIMGYVVVGAFDMLGNVTTAAEGLLIVLLVVEAFSRR